MVIMQKADSRARYRMPEMDEGNLAKVEAKTHAIAVDVDRNIVQQHYIDKDYYEDSEEVKERYRRCSN